MDKYAVIVAGGSGTRMNSSQPKQFLKLDGIPVLMHTINRFSAVDAKIKIILVLPNTEIPGWEDLIEQYSYQTTHQVVAGGPTRYDSVKNGLALVPEGALVAIHDGVRPLTSRQLIISCYESAEKFGSGVAAVNSKDSIRKVDDSGNYNVERSEYRLMQTPQTFTSDIIKAAFLNYSGSQATDDATIAECNGSDVHLVEGDYKNLKITTPEDMIIAQALIDNNLVS